MTFRELGLGPVRAYIEREIVLWRGKIRPGVGRGKAVRRSRSSMGHRRRQRRPVRANRLFGVVNPPGEDFLPGDPSIRM